MFFSSTVLVTALSLAGPSLAVPTPVAENTGSSGLFILGVKNAGKYHGYGIHAVGNGTANSELLIFAPGTGTQAQLTANEGNFHTLDFKSGKDSKQNFGASLPDPGEVDGYSGPINLGLNYKQNAWAIGSDGTLLPKLTAADQQFFACNATIAGELVLQLKFGNNQENGSAPAGCFSVAVGKQ